MEKKNTPLLGVVPSTRVKRLLLRLARPLKNVWSAFPPHVCALLPLSLCTRYVTLFLPCVYLLHSSLPRVESSMAAYLHTSIYTMRVCVCAAWKADPCMRVLSSLFTPEHQQNATSSCLVSLWGFTMITAPFWAFSQHIYHLVGSSDHYVLKLYSSSKR